MTQIEVSRFPLPGLYLLWNDGTRLDLTHDGIASHARAMLDDPARIPPAVKAAADYQPCNICPQRDTAEICHAIMTALPFIEEIDRYMSYDHVTAVYRDQASGILHVVETTMQEALKFVALLGLLQYCETGKKYVGFFRGVDPLMPPSTIASLVFCNLYFDSRGNLQEIERVIRLMQEEVLHTTRCQVTRLRLISRRDAFLNAFVSMHTTTELLFMELSRHIRQLQASPPAQPA